MMTTPLVTFLFTLFAMFSCVASVPINVRDVFVPPVLYPGVGVVWKAGETYQVAWNVSNPPTQITNKHGQIILAKGDRLIGLNHPLAAGFDILLGRYPVMIPADTEPGDDYSIVVFGDSGNNGGRFTITK